MLQSERAHDVLAAESPRKRSSITRIMMPFRSSKNNSPRSSIDGGSPRSSIDVDYTDEFKPRRFSKPWNASNVTTVQSTTSLSSNGSNKLRKGSTLAPQSSENPNDEWERDRVTGERKDPTNMLHTLAHDFDAPGVGKAPIIETGEPSIPAADLISVFPEHIWKRIISSLSLPDEACLALSAKAFQPLCTPDILRQLNDPDNFRDRCEFLYRLNYALPNHLLCYVCGVYHVRTKKGKESLRPTNVANPIFVCPYATSNNPAEKLSKHRITFGRHLPINFAQLVMRHHHHGSAYGIHYNELGRRYKDKPEIGNWSHQTRWAVIDDHLYMRVVSTAFVTPNLPPAGKRHLLYSREDFVPFFSVCAHWRDGELMPSCKCALDHVPAPLTGSGVNRVAKEALVRLHGAKSQIVTGCDNCKPLRRCPECPSEYLIEIRISEDRYEQDPTKLFKHAIVVTRWSDLGDISAPWTPEWAAVQGDLDQLPDGERYDSFKLLGRRAISGVFESFFNPEQIPPARLISLNPNMEKLGEKGHNWY